MDISSYQEALILNRTLRVFSQSNLIDLVSSAIDRPSSSASNQINSSHFDHFHNEKYLLFSESNISVVKALMESLQGVLGSKLNFYQNLKLAEEAQKKAALENRNQSSSSLVSSLFKKFNIKAVLLYVKEFLIIENAHNSSTQDLSNGTGKSSNNRELKALENKLLSSLNYLSEIFSIEIPPPPTNPDSDDNNSSSKMSPRKLKEIGQRIENFSNLNTTNYIMPAGNYAEFDLDNNFKSVKLTENGRKELFNSGGRKHAPIVINQHYDDLSVMGTEIYVLLVVARIFGRFLSSYFSEYLEKVKSGAEGWKYDFGRFWFIGGGLVGKSTKMFFRNFFVHFCLSKKYNEHKRRLQSN